MYLLAGLGNPGAKYEATRHNIGFLAIDYIAAAQGLVFSDSKWQSLISKATLWGEPVVLAKPQTFMNASGKAIAALAAFFKLDPARIIVVHDELDLPLGRVKIVVSRGAGGHNGIRSIIAELGTSSFCRVRAGIGRPEEAIPVTSYVLSDFKPEEKPRLDEELKLVGEAVRLIIQEGVPAAMTRANAGQRDNLT